MPAKSVAQTNKLHNNFLLFLETTMNVMKYTDNITLAFIRLPPICSLFLLQNHMSLNTDKTEIMNSCKTTTINIMMRF